MQNENSLSSELVSLWDTQAASDFFVKYCGSKTTAIQFLESTIEHIDPTFANRKRQLSDPDPGAAAKASRSENEGRDPYGPPGTYDIVQADDAIADRYVNDSIDMESLTLAILTPNDIGLSSHMIGKQGSNVVDIRKRTNVKIQLERVETVPLNATDRNVFFTGKLKDLCRAYQLMQKKMDEKFDAPNYGQQDLTKIVVPNELCAHLIGKAGVIIKKIQLDSGARTQVQTEEEMFQLSSYYGRAILITGTLRQRCLAVYFILRQIMSDRDLPALWKGGWPNPCANNNPMRNNMMSNMSQHQMGGGGHPNPYGHQQFMQPSPYGMPQQLGVGGGLAPGMAQMYVSPQQHQGHQSVGGAGMPQGLGQQGGVPGGVIGQPQWVLPTGGPTIQQAPTANFQKRY